MRTHVTPDGTWQELVTTDTLLPLIVLALQSDAAAAGEAANSAPASETVRIAPTWGV